MLVFSYCVQGASLGAVRLEDIFYCEQNDAFIAGFMLEQLARNNDIGPRPFIVGT